LFLFFEAKQKTINKYVPHLSQNASEKDQRQNVCQSMVHNIGNKNEIENTVVELAILISYFFHLICDISCYEEKTKS